jgi:predicted nucleic acid-binding protein
VQAFFLDSSALVKRYVRETGTSWVISLLRPAANRIYVAHITLVEVAAALSRRALGGSIIPADAARAIRRLRRSFDRKLFKIAIGSSVLQNAVDLAQKHGLRGYDAVQLAAAIEVHQQRANAASSPIVFVSADSELNFAAQSSGLLVEDPNNHP